MDQGTGATDAPSRTDASVDVTSPGDFRAGFVALVGRPNVGKSTLLNAFVGEKVAIVSRRPQTTRRRILGIRSTGEAQVVFVDTPGIHRPRSPLGRYMVSVARGAIPDADVVLWVVDVSTPPDATERSIAELILQAGRPCLLAMNKSDLLRPEDIASRTAAYVDLASPADWTLTIATAGHNLEQLWAMILALLPPSPPLFPLDQISDQTDRVLAAELVREAALTYLSDEIPHGLDVAIEEWSERPNGAVFIAATVIVERDSHKGIVVGKGGSMIRKIGTRARRGLETLLEVPVYLELYVKVKSHWRQHEGEIRRLGYQ